MSKKFVISDTWFNRPNGKLADLTVGEYNDKIVNGWNSIVKDSDTVFVLGGFGIGELYNIAIRLKGKIHFLNNLFTNDERFFMSILKENIKNSVDKRMKNRFVYDDNQIISLNDDDVILSYFPLNDWYGKDTGTVCIHGLSDKTSIKDRNISCCAQKTKLKPIEIDKVKSTLYTIEANI